MKNPTAPTADPAAELEIIAPDVEVTLVNGRIITVREYAFLDGLKLQNTAAPVLDALADGEDITVQRLSQVFGEHAELMPTLMAAACDLSASEIRALNDHDGQVLLAAFWRVNKDFFVQRLLVRKVQRWQPQSSEPAPDLDGSSAP